GPRRAARRASGALARREPRVERGHGDQPPLRSARAGDARPADHRPRLPRGDLAPHARPPRGAGARRALRGVHRRARGRQPLNRAQRPLRAGAPPAAPGGGAPPRQRRAPPPGLELRGRDAVRLPAHGRPRDRARPHGHAPDELAHHPRHPDRAAGPLPARGGRVIPMLGSPRREVDKRAFDAVRRELGFSLVRCAGHSPEGWEIEYQSPEGTLKMATLAGRIELRQGALIAALTRLDNDALGRVQERWEVRAGEVVEATEEPATDLHLLKAVVRTHPHVRQLLATGFCGRPGYPEEPQDLVGAHFAILANARPKAFPSVG